MSKILLIFQNMSENECETWWEYWSMFADKGLFVPVKDCECIIGTGGAQHISVSRINAGPHEMPIMRKCIAALCELGQIDQNIDAG